MNIIPSRGGRTIALAVLGIGVFEALLPIALMLLNAFKTAGEITESPLAAPLHWRWENFAHAWQHAGGRERNLYLDERRGVYGLPTLAGNQRAWLKLSVRLRFRHSHFRHRSQTAE